MNTNFIKNLTETIARVEQTARVEFGPLDAAQLNWRPAEDRWSIGQCLDHLVIGNTPYFQIFESIRNGTKQTTFWERLPLLPGIWGALVLKTVKPGTTRKSRAPKIFTPSREPVPSDIVEKFCQQQRELTTAIEALAETGLDAHIITSPVARFVTYSLRSALAIIVAHEERHLQQAQNVLSELRASTANI